MVYKIFETKIRYNSLTYFIFVRRDNYTMDRDNIPPSQTTLTQYEREQINKRRAKQSPKRKSSSVACKTIGGIKAAIAGDHDLFAFSPASHKSYMEKERINESNWQDSDHDSDFEDTPLKRYRISSKTTKSSPRLQPNFTDLSEVCYYYSL